MLIDIDDSVLPALADGDGASITSFETIVRAFREGKHIVTLGKRGSEYLRLDVLSAGTKGAIKNICSRQSELDGLRKVMRCFARVGAGFSLSEERTDTQTIYRLPLVWFCDSLAGQECALLGENLSDAALLEKLAAAWFSHAGWTLRTTSEPQGGGGSTIVDAFEAICQRDRVCLCVADSDRTFPGHNGGANATRLSKIVPRSPVQKATILPVREIENLVPPTMLVDCSRTGHSGVVREEVLRYDDLCRRLPGEWPDFVDLKKGLCGGAVESLPDNDERRYWTAIREMFDGAGRTYQMPCDCSKPCGAVMLPGLGAYVPEMLAKLEMMSSRTLASLCSFDSHQHVREVASLVAAWTCAMPPLRS